ncbi:MAG: DUF1631 family protein [Proteobacteria bacterium]|nr:DUF1631 family protein [Pseudomonadota bacterium]
MELNTGARVVSLPQHKGMKRSAILRLVKNNVDEKTDFLIDGLKANIADALFEEMTNLSEQQALAHHFNIMRAMKVDELKYRDVFDALLTRTWDRFLEKQDEDFLENPTGKIAALIKSLSDRTTNHYKVLINDTRYRFQTLFQRELDWHPLFPDIYYRAFWQALKETNLSYDERCLVVPLFHRFVMDRYGQILLTANRTLIELKIDTTIQLPTSSQ